jgi:hypothetical protein
LQVTEYKIRHPELKESHTSGKFPIGVWTDNKIDLIELVYAIAHARSIDNGKVSIKAIKEGFELVFGIDLGNPHDRLDDISNRKGTRPRYLLRLYDGFNELLDSMDAKQ